MKKYMKKKNRKKGVCLAAAAMTVALLAGQIPPAALEVAAAVEMSMIIPDNVTIDSPTRLSDVRLPQSEYGSLIWADDSFIPSQRVQSCEVIFIPAEGIDVEGSSTRDGEIYSTVTVVVTNPETGEEDSRDEEEYTEDSEENTDDAYEEEVSEADSSSEESPEEKEPEESDTEEKGTEETAEDEEESAEESSAVSDETEESDPEQIKEEDKTEESDPEQIKKEDKTEESSDSKENENPGKEKEPEDGETGEESKEPAESEETMDPEVTGEPEESSEEEDKEAPAEEEKTEETEGAEETTEEAADSDPANEEETEEEQEKIMEEEPLPEDQNIFDRTPEQDEPSMRVINLSDDLTEEEQQAQAAINHSCNGIYVSGIELPWYVQFRASAGADYEFSNEDTAEIFKSYEFELWDLKNHVPYMIPDGEYISVTVPVKAGYDYTVEHILGNGGTETIVPDVNGSTLVFSTHSFSPFSIAGSQPLVGNDVAEKGYASPTPTPIKNSGTSGSSQTVGNTGSSGTANASGSSANSNSQNTYYDDSSDQQEDYSDDSQEDTSGTVKNAVKTGDDTQILPFVILVGAAVILIILVIFLKRKKK